MGRSDAALIGAALILIGVVIVVGALLIGGRFTAVATDRGNLYVVDRFSGEVWTCTGPRCRKAQTLSPTPTPESPTPTPETFPNNSN